MTAQRPFLGFGRATLMALLLASAAPAAMAQAPDAAMPAWVAERQQAASAVPEGKQSALNIWMRYRQGAANSAKGGDLTQALDRARQALQVARDNFGERHMATIVSGTELAQVETAAGQLAEAEGQYTETLALAASVLGAGHPETLKIHQGLAELFANQARFDKAAKAQADMAKAASTAFGPDHQQVLSAELALARTRSNAGLYADAQKLLASTCPRTRKAFGAKAPEVVRCLTQQGAVERQLGNYDQAEPFLAEAMAMDPSSLATRLEMAELLARKGKLAEAQQMLEAIIKDAGADKSTAMAARSDLVDVLDEKGDYAKAEAMAREVLDYQTGVLGPNHPNTVATLTSLGSVQRKQGRLMEAEATFNDAYERFKAVLGDNHRSTIIAENNLGEILEKEGLYDRAEPFLRGALAGAQKAFGETHPTTLVSMNNLGLLYESQGNFDKAEALYKSVITAFGKRLGPNHATTVAFVNNLAYLYMLKEEFDKAAPMFRQVIDAWTKSYGPNHQNTLKAVNSLGRVYHRLGKLPDADKLLTQAYAARRATLGDKHLDTLRSMHDLGALWRTRKELDKAEAMLTKTLALDEEVLGKAHPYTFETINTLAGVKQDKGDLKGAYEVRRTGFLRRNDFLNRVLYVTGENAREGYIRLHQPELAAYIDLLTRMDPETAGKGILEISLNRKGLLLKVASEITQMTRLSRSPELAAITGELDDARRKLAALTLSGPTEETKDRHVEVIAGLEDTISRLQGELGRASVRFKKTVRSIEVDELVNALPEDAVVVDFYLYGVEGKTRLAAATLRKEMGKPVFGLVQYPDSAAIDAAVIKYRGDIQSEELELDDVLDTGQKVYDLVWKPLEDTVSGRKKLYVVPDGTLNILPFSALVDQDRKYLMEHIDLHVFTTTRNLLPSELPAAKGGYFIEAGPDYNTEDAAGKDTLDKARSRSRAGSMQEGLRGMSSGMRGLKFDPLPGAEKEGRLIMEKVETGGRPGSIYSKNAAQEKVLRDLAEPPEILHIATHGFFLKADDTLRKRLLKLQRSSDFQFPPPGDNPLLRSGLAFAGINANAPLLGEIDTDNDGVLTALEVLSLNLTGTKLAILSACETGLGEIHEGEGVYGLRRSFQEAGVGSVVSSLWEVSDAGTQTLMASLYARLLAGKSPHQALREAQLEMLRTPQWSSPYIWSAFFMVDG
ncbi:MAG: tetratricopeptide repeat protein [Actinomycetota bacterium]